jgi:hypothetical protein
MNSDSNLHARNVRMGFNVGIAVILVMTCAACRNGATGEIPDTLPGTSWEFDDFYIAFTSESALNILDENGQDVLLQGTYTVADGFIEVAIDDHVRAGSWDGERLLVDGMVGRFAGPAT